MGSFAPNEYRITKPSPLKSLANTFLTSKNNPNGEECAVNVLTETPVESPSCILPEWPLYSLASGPIFCTPGENFIPAGLFGKVESL